MSFKVFSNKNKESKEFSMQFLLASLIFSSVRVIYKGEIAPFNGVRNSWEKDDSIFVL